ncbi:uncharacterized protein [Haliotis cracherodii]|uniref:uncharacterized protein n=1 Tax=Haliotis cracherodii TaxID=6455 RepID=UPI0039E7698C
MSQINQLVFFVIVFTLMVFLSEFIEGRGILRRKHKKKQAGRSDDSVEIYFKRTSSDNTEVICHGSGCKRAEEQRRRHHHGKPKNMNKKKHGKNKKKRRRKNRQRKEKSQMAAVSLEDMFQSEDVLADHHERASYDQYYAGFGRGFDRLQRPPEADRLERRLHPSMGTSTHHLVSSMDRVIMALKSNIQQMHDTYDFAFNSTRYTIMMGVRHELQNIAKANDMVYDVVMDISLLTKDIYMRAHKRGDTRPRTYRKQEMPKFKSFRQDLDSVQNAQRLSKVQFDQAQHMVDECEKQTSYVLQLEEILADNTNEHELADLVRHVNMTVWKLQAEFDTAMVARKLGRFSLTNGATARDDIIVASNLVRKAKEELRVAAATSRGNRIAAGDLKRQRGGGINPLAPVSFTDRRPHRGSRSRPRRASTTYITAAERDRLRPIINRAVSYANKLERQANNIARLMNPLIRQAKNVGQGGGGVPYRLQASLLADRLIAHVKQIHTVLDRIRLAINDEDELRRRCEELEMGSGDDSDVTPIDCDDYVDVGSALETALTSTDPDADGSDFVFDEDKLPKRIPDKALKNFGDKLRVHIVQLGQKGDVTLIKSQVARNKSRAFSTRWNVAQVNLQSTRRFVDDAKQFLSDWDRERPNIDRISDRIKDVHDRVDLVYNMTQSKTFQAVLKAERKVAEVKGGGGSGDAGNRGSGGSESQDFAAAIEATGKAQTNMRSMLTLTRLSPSMVAGVDLTVGQIQANISSLRNKVEKARMMLASIQMSINKQDEDYLALPLVASDDSLTLRTSVEVCIRPEVADGPILLLSGNNSESYGLSMSSNSLKMTVYDKEGYETGDVDSTISLEKDKWYNVLIQRNGQNVALMVRSEGSGDPDVVEDSMDMSYGQPPPLAAYVGGAPDTVPMSLSSDVWKGCVGGLRVNGRSVGLLQKTSDGKVPAPCTSSCSPSLQPPSMVFEGDGYAHYPVHTAQLRYPTKSVYFEFRTRQKDAFLMTVVKRGFQLRAQLQDGTLVIETTTPSEAVVLTEDKNKYSDGLFHTLKIGYRDSKTYPEIDGKEGLFSIERTRPERIQTPTKGILIGGMLPEQRERMGNRFRPLIGCVRKLQINDVTMTMSDVERAEGVHIGSCSSNNPLFSCVQFVNTSSPIAYGTTEDAAAVVIVATRASRGPILQYQKGDKFNAIISMEENGIAIVESKKSYDGQLDYAKNDHNMFVVITITDKDSTLTVKYLDKEASINYGGGWLFGGGDSNTPYTVTIGGQDEDDSMSPFSGGISQMIVGKQYLDMTKYITDNGLSSCPSAHRSDPVSVDVRRR